MTPTALRCCDSGQRGSLPLSTLQQSRVRLLVDAEAQVASHDLSMVQPGLGLGPGCLVSKAWGAVTRDDGACQRQNDLGRKQGKLVGWGERSEHRLAGGEGWDGGRGGRWGMSLHQAGQEQWKAGRRAPGRQEPRS